MPNNEGKLSRLELHQKIHKHDPTNSVIRSELEILVGCLIINF